MIDNIWKFAKIFLGTITAYLASITAILYSIGFITERANLDMLGASKIPMDNIVYLKSGALFFLKSLLCIQSVIIYFFSILVRREIIIILLILIITIFISRTIINKTSCLLFYLNIKKQIFLYLKNKITIIRATLSIIIGFLLLPIYIEAIEGNNNLLFYKVPTEKKSLPLKRLLPKVSELDKNSVNFLKEKINEAEKWEENKIRQNIIENNVKSLYIRFGLLFLWIFVFYLCIKSLFHPNVNNSQKNNILIFFLPMIKFFAIIIFSVEIFLLLINYGYTVESNYYQICNITFVEERKIDLTQRSFAIIGENNEYIAVYGRSKNKSIIIFKKSHIKELQLLGSQNIFNDNAYHEKLNNDIF
jgi:hypothetical protein